MSAATDYLSEYVEREWVPVPAEPKSKECFLQGWPDRQLADVNLTAEFSSSSNVGIVLGTNSGGLVDIDLDCDEAVEIAHRFLPPTGVRFGRKSRPNSHWIYKVEDCGSRIPFEGIQGDGTLVEYRANGCQTLFTPSINPSGEVVEFTEFSDATEVGCEELKRCVEKLAAATLISKHWPKGSRHSAALALAGALLNSQWTVEDVTEFVTAVCEGARDSEIKDRLQAVADTAGNRSKGEDVTGWPRLSDLVGSHVVEKVTGWLSIQFRQRGIGDNGPPDGHVAIRWTDIGNAKRFSSQHRKHARWVSDMGVWIVWQGNRWAVDQGPAVTKFAQETAKSIFQEVADEPDSKNKEELSKWAVRTGNQQRLQAMVEQSKPHMLICFTELDKDPWLLNCKNGVVNLLTGKLSKPDPNLWLTKLTGTNFDPDANCPEFEKFLNTIMGGDDDLIRFVQRAFGYSLTGSTKEQCFFIAHGNGANGKSTLINVVRDILGDYAANSQIESFSVQKFTASIRNDLARLRGARLVTTAESEKGQELAESLIKQLTGGDRITTRFMRKEFFEFVPTFKLWLATNHKPKIAGDDSAFWRRVHLLPFEITIPPDQQDKDLVQRLMLEAEGILAWAVKGCLKWQKAELSPPDRVKKATDEYQGEMDFVRQFVDEEIGTNPDCVVTKADMHKAYQNWRWSNGGENLSQPELTRRLKQLGLDEGRNNQSGRHWKGVYLASHLDRPFNKESEESDT